MSSAVQTTCAPQEIDPMKLLHPQTEGVFLGPPIQCEGETQIEDWRPYRKPLTTEDGTIWHDQFEMDDGTYYRVKTGIPNHPQADVPIEFTTAWMTGNQGHNHRTFLRLMNAGFPVRLLGPPHLHVPMDWRFFTQGPALVKQAFDSTMAADVHNYLLISDALNEKFRYAIQPNVSIEYGESRGAMEGLGKVALGASHGRQVLYTEIVDPCAPRQLNHGDWKHFLNIAMSGDVPWKLALKMSGEARTKYYGSTMNLSLDYWIAAIGQSKTLASGQAGDFGRAAPLDTNMHITLFDRSFSNSDEWRSIFRNHTGVKLDELEGAHLTLTAREMIFRSLARLVAFREELEAHGDHADLIDFERIHKAKSEVPTRIKPSKLVTVAA